MDGFTLIDAGAGIVILVSGILAYARGFVREALAILGGIAAVVIAYTFAGTVEPLIRQIPVVGDVIGDSCEPAIILAFAAVFSVVLVVLSIFTPLFSSAIKRSPVGGLDQGLGFFFGVARGILLVVIAFFIYQQAFASQNIAMIENSRSAQVFGQLTGNIENQNPEDALGWLETKYQGLADECTAPAQTQ